MIKVENISKEYSGVKVLDSVSFEIEKGEIVGFLGPNGAGKSTMMKIMNSYLLADEGNVEIAGKNIVNNEIEAKSLIGYLPENNPLYIEMYVREYLEYIANIYGVDKREINKVIEKTGLSKESAKKIQELSKGYKQRVGLAAAIIHNPDYLILDEPTTGLDPNQILEIRNLIKDFAKEKTVLLSTHIMQEVEAMCERVIIINNGKLVKDQMLSDFTAGEEPRCRLTFADEIDLSLIEKLAIVLKVRTEDNKSFIIDYSEGIILDELNKLAKENSTQILSFNIAKMSLEDSFRLLTK